MQNLIAFAKQRVKQKLTRKNNKILLLFAILALYLVIIPWLIAENRYYLGLITTASATSIIAAGVWLTFYIGRINIGQGAFALIGGYALAILVPHISFWLALPLSGLITAMFGVLIGLPILRLRGVYFAMITLSLTEVARLSAQAFSFLTGGATGITNIPPPEAISVAGIEIIGDFSGENSHIKYYFLAAILTIICYAALYRLVHSRIGWLFRSLQQNEDLAASFGVNIAKLRLIAYAISCFLGGIGGAFFVSIQQNIYPATFQIQDSIYLMLYCFLGGLGYVFGPIIGAFTLIFSFEFLQTYQSYQSLLYSFLMIGLMLLLPNGILSLRWKWPKF